MRWPPPTAVDRIVEEAQFLHVDQRRELIQRLEDSLERTDKIPPAEYVRDFIRVINWQVVAAVVLGPAATIAFFLAFSILGGGR